MGEISREKGLAAALNTLFDTTHKTGLIISNKINGLEGKMAEREGFEPSKAFTPYTLSKRARSTTLPPLRKMVATHPVLPKARRRCYRCSLPGLAEFTTCRLQGTKMGHHGVRDAKGIDRQFLY